MKLSSYFKTLALTVYTSSSCITDGIIEVIDFRKHVVVEIPLLDRESIVIFRKYVIK